MTKLAFALSVVLSTVGAVHAQENLKPVKLVTVEGQNTGIKRQFFGKVVARQTVDLAFQVGGQVVELPAVEGQVISKGGMVARLDLEPFERSQQQATLQKDQADRVVQRYEQLQGNVVSQVTLDDAVTQSGLAEVALRDAEYALEHATLHAPYDALVAERIVENFTTISAGTAVVRLHDMSELRIEIDVPEVLFQRAGNDPNVVVTASFPASDEVFPIEIREFNAETSSVGQTFQLTFGLAPPEGLRILPGSSVTVTATLKEDDTSISVPATALMSDGAGGLAALVFDPQSGDQGTLRKVPVEAQPDATGTMRVLSGLEAGTDIVAMGVGTLKDGQIVRRFLGFGQ